jgi:PAS domain S-box-containing protein
MNAAAAADLRASSILENISDGVNILDHEWRYVYVNPAGARMVQRTPEQLLGKNLWELWPAAADSPFGAAYRKAMTERVFVTVEAFYPEPLNAWYEVRCHPSPEGLILLFNDISERKNIEAEVLRAKEEWERAFDTVPYLITLLDEQHRIVRVNKCMAQRLGMTPEQCVGKSCHEAVHGSDHPLASCPHTLTCADRREHSAEVHEERLGGDFLVTTTPLFDGQGRTAGSVHVARDITVRKKAEEALREAQAFNESTLNALADVFFVFDPQGKFLKWNVAVQRVTGYTDEETAAMTPADFIAVEDRPRVAAAIERVFREGSASVEAGYLTKGGRCIPYQFTGSSLKDSKGNTIGCVGIGRDLSELKRYERELLFKNTLLSAQQEASLDGILVVDEDARILSFNGRFIEIMGVPRELVVAQTDEPVLGHVAGLVNSTVPHLGYA